MSKRDTRTPEERERDEIADRAHAADARLDEPLTRRDVVDALQTLARLYTNGNGNGTSHRRRAQGTGKGLVMTALSNHALADRIAALDWSGASLQHQLAVAAAVETLRADAVSSSVIPCPNPDGCNWPACSLDCHWRPGRPTDSNIIPFRSPSLALLQGAAYTPERRVTLMALDGTPLANALCSRNERWDWIVETVCELAKCDPEQVACEDDTVTVDGLAAFEIC